MRSPSVEMQEINLETNANSHPRLFRGFLWSDNEQVVMPLASLTETLRPLPSPPPSALSDPVALSTLHARPDLFRIITPINVARFTFYLSDHPNRPLVDSVVRGLTEGFWPFAETEGLDFPDTWDEEMDLSLGPREHEFIAQYVVDEEQSGRYSHPFGPALLPGMYSMPVHAVPKPNSDKLRFINNHSAGRWALNSMIDKEKIGMRPDNVQDLGKNLLHIRQQLGDVPVWLWKSDVKNAYRLLPLHPLWQLKQVVTTTSPSGQKIRRIDRNLCFGSRGSPDLWISFMALVIWIAVKKFGIDIAQLYMDDTYGPDTSRTLELYAPYNRLMPPNQARLLRLWDELGIPHADEKQLYGRALTIIGFYVDSVSMTITLPVDKRTELVSAIHGFVNSPDCRRTLREWQRMLGWINWGLNVQPLLRPALQSLYEKLRYKTGKPWSRIYLNKRTKRDLLWIAHHLDCNCRVYLLRARAWTPSEAHLTIFCDASLEGIGIWCPFLQRAFTPADMPDTPPGMQGNIFWYEALTVLAALRWACSLPRRTSPFRVAIFTDNLNTVQIFHSLRAEGHFVDILLVACSLLIEAQPPIDLRVWHVPGVVNIVADALSRNLIDIMRQYCPYASLSTFIPPRWSPEGGVTL